MSNVIDANIPSKKEKEETHEVEVDLFFSIIFDGLSNQGEQEKIRNSYLKNEKIVVNTKEKKCNLEYSVCENPHSENPTSGNIESNLVRHYNLIVALTPYNDSKYIEQLSLSKSFIENKVNEFVVIPNVGSINVFFYLVGYNQGEFISNIVNSINEYDNDDKLKEELEKYFNFSKFLPCGKIKKKVVENITMLSPIGLTKHVSGLFEMVTGRSDLLYNPNDYTKESYDFPSEDKISVYDAAVMCQHTYQSESAADRSIFSIIHSWFVDDDVEASKDGDFVSIKLRDHVYDTNGRIVGRGKWLSTGDKWISVGDENQVDLGINIIKESKISLASRFSGFYSKLYLLISRDKNEVSLVYCTAGTEPLSFNDWFFTNFLQGLTGISLQYTHSVRNAKKLDQYCLSKKWHLFFVGHSLGGGLASNNALVTKSRHAITFNAAGLNPFRIAATLLINNPKDYFNRSGRKKRIHPFIIDGELIQLLRYVGQPAMGVGTSTEKRYLENTVMIDDEINVDNMNQGLHLGNMTPREKHNVMNFLKIKNFNVSKVNE